MDLFDKEINEGRLVEVLQKALTSTYKHCTIDHRLERSFPYCLDPLQIESLRDDLAEEGFKEQVLDRTIPELKHFLQEQPRIELGVGVLRRGQELARLIRIGKKRRLLEMLRARQEELSVQREEVILAESDRLAGEMDDLRGELVEEMSVIEGRLTEGVERRVLEGLVIRMVHAQI